MKDNMPPIHTNIKTFDEFVSPLIKGKQHTLFDDKEKMSIEDFFNTEFTSTQKEMFAFEKLYAIQNMSFKRLNTKLKNKMPSVLWNEYIE